jgi:hypothetical protein
MKRFFLPGVTSLFGLLSGAKINRYGVTGQRAAPKRLEPGDKKIHPQTREKARRVRQMQRLAAKRAAQSGD